MNIKVNAILTAFNRCQKTLYCLNKLNNNTFAGLDLKVTLYDDGSTDETSSLVGKLYPEVKILKGVGSAYWNGGMRAAWQSAAEDGPDFYLWLNDDTLLDEDALYKLLNTSAFFADQAIIVGSTKDALTGKLTYGGVRRLSWSHPLRFTTVEPTYEPLRIDTMNGNCVLIPVAVYQRLGILSPSFTHSMGDFDYGLRAHRLGIEMWTAPGFVGTCSRNQVQGTWQDRSLSRRQRLQRLRAVKGLPPREWANFSRRHGGLLWPIFWVMPYLRVVLQHKIHHNNT